MEKLFYHQGYTGNSNYSPKDRCWHGKILGINDLVTYEAGHEEDLEAAFKEAVDEYLEFRDEVDGNDAPL